MLQLVYRYISKPIKEMKQIKVKYITIFLIQIPKLNIKKYYTLMNTS